MTDKFDCLDLDIRQGNTETFTFTVTQGGVAVNLTGATITAQCRRQQDEAEKIFDITITDAQYGSVFSTGTVALRIPATSTERIETGNVYEVKSTLSGVVTTLVYGKFNAYKAVNR